MDDPPHIGPDRILDDGDHRQRDHEARLAMLRAAIQRGIDDGESGRVVELDEAFDRVEAMLDEMESARRA
jgi:predicted transcriptional regulator